MSINVTLNSTELTYDTFTFNGGEEHVRFHENKEINRSESPELWFTAKLSSSSEVMKLFLLTDAAREICRNIQCVPEVQGLILPYLPYGRQDRYCNIGEAHSLKVFAKLINSLKFDRVLTVDPHSDACHLIDNLSIITQSTLFAKTNMGKQIAKDPNKFILLAADGGALKKTGEISEQLGCEMIVAEKKRELSTGKILRTVIHDADLIGNKTPVVVDDICDGGRTFIELAKVLPKDCKRPWLHVTHGIFSKGEFSLFDHYARVSCTDSLSRWENITNTEVEVLKI